MKKLKGIELNHVRVGKIMEANFNGQVLPCIVSEIDKYDEVECTLNVKVITSYGTYYVPEMELFDLSTDTNKLYSTTVLEWETLGKGTQCNENFNSNLSILENRRLK